MHPHEMLRSAGSRYLAEQVLGGGRLNAESVDGKSPAPRGRGAGQSWRDLISGSSDHADPVPP